MESGEATSQKCALTPARMVGMGSSSLKNAGSFYTRTEESGYAKSVSQG